MQAAELIKPGLSDALPRPIPAPVTVCVSIAANSAAAISSSNENAVAEIRSAIASLRCVLSKGNSIQG